MRALLVMLRLELSLSRAGSPNILLEKRKKPSCGSDVSSSAAKAPSVAPPTTTGGGSASEERRIKFRDFVEFKYDGNTPLAYAPLECAELIRQIRGGAKDMPHVKYLLFKDAYVDAARTKSDGSMNYVVELYDTALKDNISKLKQSDKLVRARDTVLNRKTSEFRAAIDKAAAEQSRLLAGKKAQKEKFMEKFGELKDKLKNAGEKIGGLERERATLEKEKTALEDKRVATALRHLKEVNRLRDSRSYEVTHERVRVQTAMIVKSNHRFAKIRDLEKRRGDFVTARSLQSQAFGAKKGLEALKESGIDTPQETIDLFAEQEKEFDAEAKRLTVSGIPEELLCLSPLHLPSTFLNEDVLAAIDPYGSNAVLIDAGTAASLQTPTSSQGDHATERFEDATAPLVLGPAPSMANLVVGEEWLIPVLRVSDANPTPPLGLEKAGSEPVDLLELSDSSAEEEEGKKSDERVPRDNPQETEEGVVDEVEDPLASATYEAGGTSDQLEARVVEEDPDRAED
ncbi:hypothetical protein F2Q70_00025932 [Brassica cretica]|uniref:DUF1204 domain-containing protein n=2 Tax=Brassica cretica TaxID=69181 RepID=A0A8S9L9S1_BRACR|nr:hypothetical protein F2Q70_00025932 [Brassica cretica]